jgi:hypothetical protein
VISIGYSQAILEAAAFLRHRDPAVATWPMPRLLEWLAHFWRLGQVGVVTEHGRVRAVGVARCVASIEEAEADEYAHHEAPETGAILWVDQLASDHPLGLPILLAQARSRFGPRAHVSGQVFKRPGALRLVPWVRVERLLKHHGLT